MPREKNVTKNILRVIHSLPQCYGLKTHGSAYSTVGTPDLIGCYRSQCFAIEEKSKKKVTKKSGIRGVSPAQLRQLELWMEAGAITGVVTSVDEFLDLIGA